MVTIKFFSYCFCDNPTLIKKKNSAFCPQTAGIETDIPNANLYPFVTHGFLNFIVFCEQKLRNSLLGLKVNYVCGKQV